jgi:hypothetical protein
MLAGPPCAAGSRSSDPPLVVHRFSNPRVLAVHQPDVRSPAPPERAPRKRGPRRYKPVECALGVQIIRQTGGNTGGDPETRAGNRIRSRIRTCGNGHFSRVVSVRENKGMGGRRR